MSVVNDLKQVLQDIVTPDIRELTVRVSALEEGQRGLRADVKELRQDISGLQTATQAEINGLRKDISGLQTATQAEINGLRKEIASLQTAMYAETNGLRQDVGNLKTAMYAGFQQVNAGLLSLQNVQDLRERVADLERARQLAASNQPHQ